jgi:ribosomal protein L37AE/L43A
MASSSSSSVSQCAAGEMIYYSAAPNSRVAMLKIPIHKVSRCKHHVVPKDIVAGVWHCKRCEPQLEKVRDTWGGQLTTVYLASAIGARGSKFKDLIITNEPKDDYLSTLGKGLLGLKHMYEMHPDKKW